MSGFLVSLGLMDADGGSGDASGGLDARQVRMIAWGAGLLGVLLCLSFAPWSVAIQGLDSMFYYFTAERVAYGTPPHLSAFSPQNALGVVLPGLGIAVGRLVGFDAVYASRVVTILCYAVSVAVVTLLGLRLFGRRSGAMFAGLVFLTFTPLAFMAAATGQPKTVLVVFVPLTLYGVVRNNLFLAGLAAACAYLSYQPALLLMGGVVVAVAVAPGWKSNIGRALAGFVLPVLAYVLYLWSLGALWEAVVQTHVFMAVSRGEEGGPPTLAVLYQLWHRIWVGGFGRWNIIPLIGGLGVLGVLTAIVLRPRRALDTIRREPGWIAVLVSGAGVAAYAAVDNGGVPDSFLGLTYLALFTTVVFVTATAFIRRRFGPGAGAGAQFGIVLGLVAIMFGGFRQQRQNLVPYGLAEQRHAAAAVGEMIHAGRSVFVLGFPYLLSMNHVDNWSIFSSSHSVRPGSGYWEYLHPGQDFIPARGDSLPDIMVVSRGKPPGWPEWLVQHFDSVGVEPLHVVGAAVWVRRAGARVGPVVDGAD
ncbi:MAG: hypothetical protein ABI587_03300 [Gemmatimonadales bacterium]